MQIEQLILSKLRNEEHFDYGNELIGLMEVYPPVTLSIEALWPSFVSAHAREDAALEVILKSALTTTIESYDDRRDGTFRGTRDLVNANCNHFNAAKKEQALRLKVVFDQYGNISMLPYSQETGKIENLCKELETNYAAELATFGLTEWVTELKSVNLDFKDIRSSRFTETANKNDDNMKEVRLEVDAAYKAIVERINAGIVFNGPTAYAAFVGELNARIENCKQTIAQRQGTAAAGNGSGEPVEGGEVTPVPVP